MRTWIIAPPPWARTGPASSLAPVAVAADGGRGGSMLATFTVIVTAR